MSSINLSQPASQQAAVRNVPVALTCKRKRECVRFISLEDAAKTQE